VAAGDVPKFVTEHQPVPAATNRPGTKGYARGRLGRCLVIVPNANIDALSDYGIRHIAMPATSEKVWRAIHAARAGIGACKIGWAQAKSVISRVVRTGPPSRQGRARRPDAAGLTAKGNHHDRTYEDWGRSERRPGRIFPGGRGNLSQNQQPRRSPTREDKVQFMSTWEGYLPVKSLKHRSI
jgi:hypothetical protein